MLYTRAQIRTQARVAADQDNATFPTDTAYNDIINRAADMVWRRMVGAGWKPDKLLLHIDPSSGNTVFTFPGPVATVDLVYPVASNSSIVPVGPPLRRLKVEQTVSLLSYGTGNNAASGVLCVAYDLYGGASSVATATSTTIALYPPPSTSSGFYLAMYTPQFAGFASDTDTWTGPEGSGELVILNAAIEGAVKEGDPAEIIPRLERQLEKREKEVLDFANFLFDAPQTVKDTRHKNPLPFNYNAVDAWDDGGGYF